VAYEQRNVTELADSHRHLVYHREVMADSKPAVLDAAGSVLAAEVASRARPNVKLIGLLALGHLVIDLNQGSFSAILPFLKIEHGRSYSQVWMPVFFMRLTSSMTPPVFGYLSDQTARRWLLPISVVLSGAGLALIGLAPTYAAVLPLLVPTRTPAPPLH